MSRAALALCAALAAVAQAGAVPAAFPDRLAGPVLPVALIAAWAVLRDPREAWPALLVAGALLGVLSEARAGWYVLALLPTAAAAVALETARLRRAREDASTARRLAAAAVAGAAGAAAYVAVLALAEDATGVLAAHAATILLGAAWTGTLAVVIAVALWPARQRGAGLFA